MPRKERIISLLVAIFTGVVGNFVWAWLTPIAPLPHTTPAPYRTVEPATPPVMPTVQRNADRTPMSADPLTFADIRDELFPRPLHPVLLTLLLLLRAVGVICVSIMAFIHTHCMGYENPPWFYRIPCHLVGVVVGAFVPEILGTLLAFAAFCIPIVIGAYILQYLFQIPEKLRSAYTALTT
jgi:uncharacterized membrane protein YeaQ/YmgE (transglycosylase-associated protein family)